MILILLALGGVGSRWGTDHAAPRISYVPQEGSSAYLHNRASWQLWLQGLKSNLNEVGRSDLMLIPGVGRSLAARIMKQRQKYGAFESWQQIDAIRGVGPKMLHTSQCIAVVLNELDRRSDISS